MRNSLGLILGLIVAVSLAPIAGCAPKKADFKKALQRLNETSYKVRVYQNGKKQGTWTQTPKDYFKLEDSKTKKVVIFMAPQNKLYDINATNKTATEIPLETINDFTKFAPPTIWDTYRKISWKVESNKKWKATKDKAEYTAFFEAPQDLLNKIIVRPNKGKSTTIKFKYSMVEEVPLTEYLLPSQQLPEPTAPGAPPGIHE